MTPCSAQTEYKMTMRCLFRRYFYESNQDVIFSEVQESGEIPTLNHQKHT
jgi:hypothetical protein